jgi:hypothetical protein
MDQNDIPEVNFEMELDELDFLLQTSFERRRAAAPGPILTQVPRRVPFHTLNNYIRPQLQRQNAMPQQERPGVFEFIHNLIEDGRQREARLLNHLQELQRLQEEHHQHQAYMETMEFVLEDMEVGQALWECAICTETSEAETVLHPAECHTFHRECLDLWLRQAPTCPLCRQAVTPLLMVPKE